MSSIAKKDNHYCIPLGDGYRARVFEVVRYRKGKTALMKIEHVETDQFGKRIYGFNIIGEAHAAYAENCIQATMQDLAAWQSYEAARTWKLA